MTSPSLPDGVAAGRTTRLLRRSAEGDERASDELFPLVYETLHGLAAQMMRAERSDHTLQATALLHEAWIRLIPAGGNEVIGAEDRDHFRRLAARAMRRVLVDHARGRAREKRGGDRERIELDEGIAAGSTGSRVVEFDEALERLEAMQPNLARIVEMRFFGGYTIDETARLLDVSHATVERGWAVARLFLAKDLGDEP